MRTAAGSFYLAVFALLSASSHASPQTSDKPSSQASTPCSLEPDALVSDACVSYSTLNSLNRNLLPYVRSITKDTDFFAYYRLNLYNKHCPFWDDNASLCGNIACAVNTITNETDIPPIWRAEELSKLEGLKAHHPGREGRTQAKPLHGELGENVGETCVLEYDDECDERDYCIPEDERASAKGDYVSLVDNPERFTGYQGEGAHMVWEAIYRENCFSRPSNTEQKNGLARANPLLGMTPGGLQQGRAPFELRRVMAEHGRQQGLSHFPQSSRLALSSMTNVWRRGCSTASYPGCTPVSQLTCATTT